MKRICAAALMILTLGFLLSACGRAPVPETATATPLPSSTKRVRATPTKRVNTPKAAFTARHTFTPTITATFTITLTATASISPTASITPTPVDTATGTITPTPTSTSDSRPTLFPMSIAGMRRGSYPGSEIVIDEPLEDGSNYQRYYAYYRSQNLKIYGLLTVPFGEMPDGGWPAIIFNHGYIPPAQYRTTERYVAYVDRLASSGYVVFKIDYRGHGHSEGNAQGAYGDPGYEVDVLNAVASLKRYPLVNPEKIGMWGHSMGGYLTLRAMVISKSVKAGVMWAGVVAPYADILYNWPEGPQIPPANSRVWMDEWPDQFGTPDDNPTFWNSVSANSYIADLSGPIQLHYGTADADVPPEFSEILAREARAAGKDVEIYSYPGDNHNITNYFNQAMDRTIEFFDSILK